ncbi:MAG: peptidylprolyl isomerase [Gammaproteobacteria bacterium]
MSQAKTGDTVRIHYTGTLTDGTEFDSSTGRDPLEFTLGEGHIIPGLEREIAGMAVGDTKTVTVPAGDAYGPHHAEAVHEVQREQIPETIDLAIGVELQATAQNGQVMRLRVVELGEEVVKLDANHPLAGQDLVFEVELVEIAA